MCEHWLSHTTFYQQANEYKEEEEEERECLTDVKMNISHYPEFNMHCSKEITNSNKKQRKWKKKKRRNRRSQFIAFLFDLIE